MHLWQAQIRVTLLLLILVSVQLSAAPGIVVIVRHSEKTETDAPDPGLSEAGESRARALAQSLRDANVTSVITTEYERSRATAGPLVEQERISIPIVVPLSAATGIEHHAQMVADAIRPHTPDETVVVIGHSHTIPAVVSALGGPNLPTLCEFDYDNLFILVLDARIGTQLLRTRVGTDDDSDAKCP